MIKVEVHRVIFANTASVTKNFQTEFDDKDDPIVKVVGEFPPGSPVVNIFISNITKESVTISASGNWTGTAHLHIFSKN
jgi:hypothetical protein